VNQLESVAYNFLGARRSFSSSPDFPSKYHLLGRGVALAQARCAACTRTFDAPRLSGERFEAAIPYVAPAAEFGGDEAGNHFWLFVGSSVLVAPANPALAPLLEKSRVFVGDRILVATANSGEGGATLVIFCQDCGETIEAKASRAGRENYVWDYVVEFEPRQLLRPMKLFPLIGKTLARQVGLLSVNESMHKSHDQEIHSAVQSDDRVRAFCFARDHLLEGRGRLREICSRALRAQVPLAKVKAAFQALGATFVRGDDGEDMILAPDGFPANLGSLRIHRRAATSSPRARDFEPRVHPALTTQFAGAGR